MGSAQPERPRIQTHPNPKRRHGVHRAWAGPLGIRIDHRAEPFPTEMQAGRQDPQRRCNVCPPAHCSRRAVAVAVAGTVRYGPTERTSWVRCNACARFAVCSHRTGRQALRAELGTIPLRSQAVAVGQRHPSRSKPRRSLDAGACPLRPYGRSRRAMWSGRSGGWSAADAARSMSARRGREAQRWLLVVVACRRSINVSRTVIASVVASIRSERSDQHKHVEWQMKKKGERADRRLDARLERLKLRLAHALFDLLVPRVHARAVRRRLGRRRSDKGHRTC